MLSLSKSANSPIAILASLPQMTVLHLSFPTVALYCNNSAVAVQTAQVTGYQAIANNERALLSW
jgi:methenyltetrahydromethanopterin cyclohydrolase